MRKMMWLLLIAFLMLLTGCSGGIDEEQGKALDQVKDTFQAEARAPNHNMNGFSLYLPFGMKIDESNPNNLLIEKGKQLYLLFINPNENPNSQVVYESTLNSAENIRVKESFEKKDKFGFIIITDIKEDLYSLTVGIGGNKMSTETSTGDLVENAKMMMEIVSSVEFNGESETE